MLVGDFVFFKKFFHLFGDHVAIVRDRDERDLFARLGRLLGRLRLFWIVAAHTKSIHQRIALFERFERGIFSELPFTPATGDEIDRFTHRHRRAKIQAHAPVIACRTGNFSEPIGDIGLGTEVKLHVGIDRKTVKAFLTHGPPLAVRLDEPLVDSKAGLLADRAFRLAESLFNLLDGQSCHRRLLPQPSITFTKTGLQPMVRAPFRLT